MVKVKVCGITSLLDAEKSLELGADMLGFNFYASSPRAIAPAKARAIIARLPRESFNIALFVNAARENVMQVIAPRGKVRGRTASLQRAAISRRRERGLLSRLGPEGHQSISFERQSIARGVGRFFRGFLFARFVVGRLWRFGDGVSVGMARRARCQQANSFRRARGGQRGCGDQTHPSLRHRCLQRRGSASGYQGS